MNDIYPQGATCPLNRDPQEQALEEAIWAAATGQRCESGWTGDRCSYPLFHAGPHSNEEAPHYHDTDSRETGWCSGCGRTDLAVDPL